MKPCPFCGHVPDEDTLYFVAADDGDHTDTDLLICNGCSANGPPGYGEDDAVEKWNTRVDS